MKNLKIFAIALAVLAAGTFAFADAAAESYLSKFTTLVEKTEACAKNKEASKAAELAVQKAGIDALRKTVTLTTIQRFSDWRLTKRYDSAYEKLKAAGATSKTKDNAGKVGEALGSAAESVGGAVKDTTTKAVQTVKDSVEGSVNSVKDGAKKKVDDSVKDAKDKVDQSVQGAADKASETIKKGAESFADKLNKLFNGEKDE